MFAVLESELSMIANAKPSPQTLLCQARLAVLEQRGYREPPSVDCYGTSQHGLRRRYDAAVHAEFHRRLAEAGIPVEGA